MASAATSSTSSTSSSTSTSSSSLSFVKDRENPNGSSDCIYVGNLDVKVKSSDLEELFAKKGKVYNCTITRDKAGISRGYGFVRMQSDADTEVAIKELNGTMLFGKPLSVQMSRPREGDVPPYFPPKGRDKRPLSPPRRPSRSDTYDSRPPYRDDRDRRYDDRGIPPSYSDSGSRMPPPSRFSDPYDSNSNRSRAPDEYKRSLPSEPKSDRYPLKSDTRYVGPSSYQDNPYSRADPSKGYTAPPPPGRDTRSYPDQGRDYYPRSDFGFSDARRPPLDTRRDPIRDADHSTPRSSYDPATRDRYPTAPPSAPSSHPSSYRSEYDKPTDIRPRSGWDAREVDVGRRDPPPPSYAYGRNDSYSDRGTSNYAPEYPSRSYDPSSQYSDRPSQNPSHSSYPDYRSESYPSGQSQYSYSTSQPTSSLSASFSSDIQSALKTLSQATNNFSTSTSSHAPTNDTYSYSSTSAPDSYRSYPPSYGERDTGSRAYRPHPPPSSSGPPMKPQDAGYPTSIRGPDPSNPYGATRSYSSITPSSSGSSGPPPYPLAPGGHSMSSIPPSGGGRGGYGYIRSDMPKPPGRYEPYRQ